MNIQEAVKFHNPSLKPDRVKVFATEIVARITHYAKQRKQNANEIKEEFLSLYKGEKTTGWMGTVNQASINLLNAENDVDFSKMKKAELVEYIEENISNYEDVVSEHEKGELSDFTVPELKELFL